MVTVSASIARLEETENTKAEEKGRDRQNQVQSDQIIKLIK